VRDHELLGHRLREGGYGRGAIHEDAAGEAVAAGTVAAAGGEEGKGECEEGSFHGGEGSLSVLRIACSVFSWIRHATRNTKTLERELGGEAGREVGLVGAVATGPSEVGAEAHGLGGR